MSDELFILLDRASRNILGEFESLEDAQTERLDQLWDELHYISHDALTLVDAYAQLMEYATQDADPKVFEPLRKPIHDRAAML